MWISFKCSPKRQFILRPFVGGVNGISGEAMVGDMTSLIRRMNSLSPKQDYLVLPEQKWLDGIATSPGRVKQFVATPMLPTELESRDASDDDHKFPISKHGSSSGGRHAMFPAGTSIERQMTGRDAVGGFQLEVIPRFDTLRMSFANTSGVVCSKAKKTIFKGYKDSKSKPESYLHPLPKTARLLDPLKSPLEQGVEVGQQIHMKDLQAVEFGRLKTLGDLWEEAPSTNRSGLKYESVQLEVDGKSLITLSITVSFPGLSLGPFSITVGSLSLLFLALEN
jgi:hypothetical protein